MAEELKNAEHIACPDCKSFSVVNEEPNCAKGRPDFPKQLASGETLVCPEAERK